MPKHGNGRSNARKLLHAHAAEIAARPVSRTERKAWQVPELELVKYHEYHKITAGVGASAIAVPPRTRKVLAGDQSKMALRNIAGEPRNRQEAFLEKVHRAEAIGGGAMRSTEIRTRGGRDFTGAKDDGASAQRAQGMRDQVKVSWDAHHATLVSGSAHREGRAEYRPNIVSHRSSVKLGDMKAK